MPPWQGDKVVNMNIAGVDAAIDGIIAVKIPASWGDLSTDEEAPGLRLRFPCMVTRLAILSGCLPRLSASRLRQGPAHVPGGAGCGPIRQAGADPLQQPGWQLAACERLRAGRPRAMWHQPVRETRNCDQRGLAEM